MRLKKKTIAMRALAAITAVIMSLSLTSVSWAKADKDTDDARETSDSTIHFTVEGKGSVTLTQITDNGTLKYTLTEGQSKDITAADGAYVHLKAVKDTSELTSITVQDPHGYTLEDETHSDAETVERDITFTGIDKTVAVAFGNNTSAIKLPLMKMSANDDLPTMGRVYTGTGTIEYVEIVSSGGRTDSIYVNSLNGILSSLPRVEAHCADHGAASPEVGALYDYTFTVTNIDTASGQVTGSFYAKAQVGSATDQSMQKPSGKGYQRISASPSIHVDFNGKASLLKSSSSPEITDHNGCYYLENAVYGIFSDSSATAQVGTFTTRADGSSNEVELKAGTYYVKEITAPRGFYLDPAIYPLTVTAGQTTTLRVTDNPQNDPAGITLNKIDKETGELLPQGSASLEGAEFTIEYYDNLDGETSGSPLKTWVIQTLYNEDTGIYRAFLDDKYKVSGDDFYHDRGLVVLPLGTYVIWESKAPEGYLLEGAFLQPTGSTEKIQGKYVSVVTDDHDSVVLQGGNEYSLSDQVIRGGVRIRKRDLESEQDKPQGSATLKGATFNIINKNDNTVYINGKHYKKNDVVMTITTDKNGIAKTTADALPYGSYAITETAPPEGYLGKGILSRNFQIKENGVTIDLTEPSQSILNQVKRGDIELIKIADGTGERLAGIPFKITSKTTGESHIIVTDNNGYASTSTDWNPHTQNTNRGKTAEDGVWFNGYNDAETGAKVDDALGALPYDTYRIEEQRCEANKGKNLLPAFDVTVRRNDYLIDLGTLTNDNMPKVYISKVDATTGEQISGATLELYKKQGDDWEKISETVTTDETWILEVETGDYRLVETMAPTGYMISNSVEFTVLEGSVITQVEMKDEPIEISGNIDKKQTIVDKDNVYYYTIDYCSTSNTWADELNVTDPLESVNDGYTRLVSIRTPVSFDDYDGLMNVWYQTNKTDPEDTTDAEAYNACKNNPENPANPENERMMDYTGWKLWKAEVSTLESQELQVADLNLAEDEYITALRFEHGRIEKGFTTRAQESSELDATKSEHDDLIEIAVQHDSTFNLMDAANKDLREAKEVHYAPAVLKMQVISAEYGKGGIELWNSANMNIFRNKGATEKLKDDDEDKVVQDRAEISIHTSAANKADGTKVIRPDKEVTIIDTVTLKGLVVGKEYILSGWQMVKSENAKLLVNGKEVTADLKFTAAKRDMEVQLAFTFDASELNGSELVTFESLYEAEHPDTPVAEHADINDKDQSVTITAEPKTPSTVKTGDNAPLLFYAIVTIASLLLIAGIIFVRRRRRM